MNTTPHRAYDDDAPIGAADVEDARRFMRVMRVVRVVFGAAFFFVAFIAAATVCMALSDSWDQVACEGVAEETRANLEAEMPALLGETAQDTSLFPFWRHPEKAVIHKSDDPEVVVVDFPSLVLLVNKGRIEASTMRCGLGDRHPRRAWLL
jgi:hypothetical protein